MRAAPSPSFLVTRVLNDYPIAELVDYIDWTPFFSTWELAGRYPAILNDAKVGEAARSLYEDARAMLDKIVAENWFKASAVADRLAEAFAERLHQRVRKEFWGYGADESLSNDELILERYRGIRPAPGYPAQPDHTEKGTLYELLKSERIGVELTESFAMWPGAAVCGLYFSHPQAAYFGVGKIERDQVEDYARRKGGSVQDAERGLAPILNYDPRQAPSIAAA